MLHLTWTLVVEVIFYAMTFALPGLTRSRPERARCAMTGVWATVCVVVVTVPGISEAQNALLPPFVGWLLVGRCIYLWSAGLIRPIVAVLNAALSLLIFLAFTENLQPGLFLGSTSPLAEPTWTYAYALIIFLGLMAAAPRHTARPFDLLGDISYSLYLLHMPVGFITFEVTNPLGFPVDLMIWSAIGASIIAAVVSYQLVERPSQRLARRLLASDRPAAER